MLHTMDRGGDNDTTLENEHAKNVVQPIYYIYMIAVVVVVVWVHDTG